MRPTFTTLVALLLLAPPLVSFAARADEAADIKAAQDRNRRAQAGSMNGIPLLAGEHTISETIHLSKGPNGALKFTTALPIDAGRQFRVNIKGFSGITVVLANAGNSSFNFNNIDFDDPKAVRIDTSIIWSQSYFSLNRTKSYLNGGYQQVQLVQGVMVFDRVSRQQVVGLQFTVSAAETGMVVHQTAPSFDALRRQCPEAVELYLRPLIKQFHFESLLAADPALAWQVFANQLKPDPEVERQVGLILPALDSDKYQVREAAARALVAKKEAGALVLMRLDRSKLSAQQICEVENALCAYTPARNSEIAILRTEPEFLIDCLYSEQEQIRSSAFAELRKRFPDAKFDLKGDADEREKAIESIRELIKSPATRPTTQPATRPASAGDSDTPGVREAAPLNFRN